MNIIAISQLRSNLPKFVDEVADYAKRYIISISGIPKAVIINLEELESIEETAKIMATPGAYKSIMRGYKQAKKGQGMSWKKIKNNV